MQPTRRTLLLGGAVGLAAACTPERAPAVVSPDERLKQRAAIREDALLQLYAAAAAAFPELAARLAPLSQDHARHRAALGAPAAVPTGAPLVAATPRAALQRLAALERETAAGHAAAAITASRPVAQVLASLAACESSHAAVLR